MVVRPGPGGGLRARPAGPGRRDAFARRATSVSPSGTTLWTTVGVRWPTPMPIPMPEAEPPTPMPPTPLASSRREHNVAAVVDVAVCRRASTTDTLLPLPSRHGAGRHRVQLSPAVPGRASPRTGESRSRRRRPPFAMTAHLRGDGGGIVVSRSRRARNGVIVASICASATRYWPGTNIYAHFHADHAYHWRYHNCHGRHIRPRLGSHP
jgi:hypothetical protein